MAREVRAGAGVGGDTVKAITVDFDGVLHSQSSGWKGIDVIPDPPVPGAIAWLTAAVEKFEVHIYSGRSHSMDGINAMRFWLDRNGLPVEAMRRLNFACKKPDAPHMMIDDRAWRFDGAFPTMDEIEEFSSWIDRKVMP